MWLAIDTSTKVALLALISDEEIHLTKRFEPRSTQKIIFGELANILDPDTMSDLDGIIVGTGPGSFTGVKIGVIAAKTLAWSRGIPIVGICSMDAVAAGLSDEFSEMHKDANVIVAVESTKGEAYIRVYTYSESMWVPSGPIQNCFIDKDSLNIVLPKNKLVLTGEASESIASAIDGIHDFIVMEEKNRFPTAQGLFKLAMDRFIARDTDDPICLVPEYHRPSQPEYLEKVKKLEGKS
jgi:tRNA threonylcarbamoyladenosine biosynthesis protein TsaB